MIDEVQYHCFILIESGFIFLVTTTIKHNKGMSSVIRCGQLVSGHLSTIQRQSVQLKKCSQILSVVPISGRDSSDIRRNYFNQQWNRQNNQQHQFPFGLNVYELISIGCVSVAIYNWKR